MASFVSWTRNEWEVGNVLSFLKAKRLSKPNEVILKRVKSQLKEVSTGHTFIGQPEHQ